jgi:multiple sugar transport system permease protein
MNSAKVAIFSTMLTVLISSMLAFAFARLQFPFKEPLFYLFLLGMMVPPVMLIIPQFLVAKWLSLFNHTGLILVYTTMNISM